jgi:hypothetical protein
MVMRAFAGAVLFAIASMTASAQTPQPFPRPNQPRTEPPAPPPGQKPPAPGPTTTAPPPPSTAAKPAAPASSATQSPAPDLGGLPMYPNAVFLTSYDAGRGQRYYLYGVNLPYLEAVNFYRTALKQRGEELFQSPPTYQFDIGRFREQDMSYPPSVTIKDYTWGGAAGYVNPKGAQPERFPTIVQVVLAPAGAK